MLREGIIISLKETLHRSYWSWSCSMGSAKRIHNTLSTIYLPNFAWGWAKIHLKNHICRHVERRNHYLTWSCSMGSAWVALSSILAISSSILTSMSSAHSPSRSSPPSCSSALHRMRSFAAASTKASKGGKLTHNLGQHLKSLS